MLINWPSYIYFLLLLEWHLPLYDDGHHGLALGRDVCRLQCLGVIMIYASYMLYYNIHSIIYGAHLSLCSGHFLSNVLRSPPTRPSCQACRPCPADPCPCPCPSHPWAIRQPPNHQHRHHRLIDNAQLDNSYTILYWCWVCIILIYVLYWFTSYKQTLDRAHELVQVHAGHVLGVGVEAAEAIFECLHLLSKGVVMCVWYVGCGLV